MYIRRLIIENYVGIGHLDLRLTKKTNRIGCPCPETVVTALQKLLIYVPPDSTSLSPGTSEDTRLCADVRAGGTDFRVEIRGTPGKMTAVSGDVGHDPDLLKQYRYFMDRCPEEDFTSVFIKGQQNIRKVQSYINEDRDFRPGEFSRITAGIGATNSFRTCVRDFILRHPVQRENAREEGDEYSFLDTALFWDAFGKLRNIHYEGKPLIMCEPSPVLIKKAEDNLIRTDRQIILISGTGEA